MPTTWTQHEKSLSEPGLCELLPIRDFLDKVMVRLPGELVAGYELKGAISYFADDAGLNTIKMHLEALLRTIPEESMRLQFRFEVTEDLGDLLQRYQDSSKSENEATRAMDEHRLAMWRRKEAAGEYLRRMTHLYLIWDPERHHRVLATSGKTAKRDQYGHGIEHVEPEDHRAHAQAACGPGQRVRELAEWYRVGDGRRRTRSAADG